MDTVLFPHYNSIMAKNTDGYYVFGDRKILYIDRHFCLQDQIDGIRNAKEFAIISGTQWAFCLTTTGVLFKIDTKTNCCISKIKLPHCDDGLFCVSNDQNIMYVFGYDNDSFVLNFYKVTFGLDSVIFHGTFHLNKELFLFVRSNRLYYFCDNEIMFFRAAQPQARFVPLLLPFSSCRTCIETKTGIYVLHDIADNMRVEQGKVSNNNTLFHMLSKYFICDADRAKMALAFYPFKNMNHIEYLPLCHEICSFALAKSNSVFIYCIENRKGLYQECHILDLKTGVDNMVDVYDVLEVQTATDDRTVFFTSIAGAGVIRL